MPRTRTTYRSGPGRSLIAVTGPLSWRSFASAAIRAGSVSGTSTAAVRVSSRVRPIRERSPNSRTIWKASRWAISSQVSLVPEFSPASSRSTSWRPCRSGGTTVVSHWGALALVITSAIRSFRFAAPPPSCRIAATSVRREKE